MNPNKVQQPWKRKIFAVMLGIGALLGAARLAGANTEGVPCDPNTDGQCQIDPDGPVTTFTKPSVPETTVPVTTIPTETTEPVETTTTMPVQTTTTTIISNPSNMPPTTIIVKGPSSPTE